MNNMDVTTIYGTQIIRDLSSHKKYVKIPSVSKNENWHKLEDVVSEGLDKMSDFYKVDMHKLSKYGKK
jgi:hypothetical protein